MALQRIGAESLGTNERLPGPPNATKSFTCLVPYQRCADAAFIERLASCLNSYKQSECVELELLMRDLYDPFTYWSVHILAQHVCSGHELNLSNKSSEGKWAGMVATKHAKL